MSKPLGLNEDAKKAYAEITKILEPLSIVDKVAVADAVMYYVNRDI